MADDIQQLRPTNVSEPEAASESHPTSSAIVVPTSRTSIQGDATRPNHGINGVTPSLLNGSSGLSRSTSTSNPEQAQQEQNSRLHTVTERTPLLLGFRRWTTEDKKTRKLLVILSMIIVFVVFTIIGSSLLIFGTIKPISHSFSKLSPTSVEVLNPLPNTDSLVELLTVNGWSTEDYLMWVKPENDEDLNVLNVYEMEERKTKWSNATYETPLTSQPLMPYYALAGSEVVFKIIKVSIDEDEGNEEREYSEKVSATLQLFNENEVSFCKHTFDVEVNESLNIVISCRISQTGYYSVSYIGNGTTAHTNITYNTLIFNVNGLKPSCYFNQNSNCSQYVSFGKKPILVLGFNMLYSTFTVNISFTPRKELYWFVIVSILVILIAAGLLALLFHFLYSRRIRPYIDRTTEHI